MHRRGVSRVDHASTLTRIDVDHAAVSRLQGVSRVAALGAKSASTSDVGPLFTGICEGGGGGGPRRQGRVHRTHLQLLPNIVFEEENDEEDDVSNCKGNQLQMSPLYSNKDVEL